MKQNLPLRKAALLFVLILVAFIAVKLFFTLGEKHKPASIYIAAHQDDWQLFMGTDFLKDAADTSRRIVLIITTSGSDKPLYSAARETGVIASVYHALGITKSGIDTVPGYSKIKAFTVPSFRAANVTVFFLRLPDGNVTGKGFAATNNVSLTKLQNNEIHDVQTTDSLNHFKNWDELATFLYVITENEIGSDKTITLHIADTSQIVNPGDHPDHIASAHLALKAFSGLKGEHILHQGYNSENLPGNLSVSDSLAVQALYNSYVDTVNHIMGFCVNCYTNSYQKWCGRSYKRKQ